MSSYLPTTWKNNSTPAINAKNLNHAEAGVSSAHKEIEDVIIGVTPAGSATTALVALSVEAASRVNLGGVTLWVDLTNPDLPIGHIGV